jgi:hypothetical protein
VLPVAESVTISQRMKKMISTIFFNGNDNSNFVGFICIEIKAEPNDPAL